MDSMDLTEEGLKEILGRAEEKFERIKAAIVGRQSYAHAR